MSYFSDDEDFVELSKDLHQPKAKSNGVAFWDEVRFPSKRGEVTKWLCVSNENHLKHGISDQTLGKLVATSLFETLQMPPPSLVISVSGFARSLKRRSSHTSSARTSLRAACECCEDDADVLRDWRRVGAREVVARR